MALIDPVQDFYKEVVATAWSTGAGNKYVSTKPTATNGYLVVSPSSATLREIVRFTGTGTDAGGDYVTIASASDRGLGGTVDQAHAAGEPVRMNITAQHWADLDDALESIVAAGAPNASTSVKGIGRVSVAPVAPTTPIFVGDNDPRVKVVVPYAADAGATDAYAITPSPAITAYAAGQVFVFKANTANTGAATLNVNGLGAKTIKKNGSSDLATGNIAAGQIVEVVYDGTNMQMLSPVSGGGAVVTTTVFNAGSATKNLADASTTQVIAHGLGVTPLKVRMKAAYCPSTQYSLITEGTWANGVYAATGLLLREGSSTAEADTAISSSSFIIRMHSDDATYYQTGTITVDATNITITWTKNGSPSGTQTFYWEVEGVITA